MKDSNFSVLFMRDDTDVKSFRVSPRRLKLLLWTLGILGLLVLVGLAVGLRSFVGYRTLLNERRSLESNLAESQVALERLGNLTKIQQSQGKEPGAAKGRPEAEAASARGQHAFQKINTGAITVENLRGQLSASSLSVSFDLNNRASAPLSGDIRLLLLRNDGSLTELSAPSQDLTYQITRFKHISTSARVPDGLSRREALGLRIEIKTSDGDLILGETYALGS